MSARVDGTAPKRSRKLAGPMRLSDNRAVHTCELCHAKVHELRRGRCWGCYARWADARPVGLGARCVTCGEQRQRVLRSTELHGRWHPMCFNCTGQLAALEPLPATLAELKSAVSRERRRDDRRAGRPDTRVFRYERRVGERRMDRAEYDRIDDDMILEVTIEPYIDSDPFEDVTRIHSFLRTPDQLAG
jgi:hypothetical protein